jgi:site-specific DNA recombinase
MKAQNRRSAGANQDSAGQQTRANKMRGAIYARYSSDLQKPTSIEDQNRNCYAAAAELGIVILPGYVRADQAISGAALFGRDALNSLIADAKKSPRPFDYIVIDDTSRLGRNLSDVLKISDILKHCGVYLYFASQRLDSSDQNFRQLQIMNGMIDEQYLQGLSEKVKRGQRGRVLNGFIPGGRCYGYRNVPIEDPTKRGDYGRPFVIGVRQEVIEDEASVISRIFDMYASGQSLADIAKALNREGVASPQRPHRHSRRAWSPTGIRDMLRNEKYIGVVVTNRYAKEINPETGQKKGIKKPSSQWCRTPQPHLRIVTDSQWEAVQRQIRLINEQYGYRTIGGMNRTDSSRTYLFSGLLTCGVCGGKMTIGSRSDGQPAYICHAHRYQGICTNGFYIRHDRLERQLIDALVSHILKPDNIELALQSFKAQLNRRLADAEASARSAASVSSQLRAERDRLLREANNLADAIADQGHRSSPTLLSRLDSVEKRIETIDSRLEEAREFRLPQISMDDLRAFVAEKSANLTKVLTQDRQLAKQALRQNVSRLVLIPRTAPSGPVFIVEGSVGPFFAKDSVMLCESLRRHQTVASIQ